MDRDAGSTTARSNGTAAEAPLQHEDHTRKGVRVAVLMAAFNGERFLDKQLATLAAQTVANIDIWVSDDGSTDRTLEILDRWSEGWSKGSFTIVQGPSKGFSENFRSLMTRGEIAGDYFAFCDQDDVWDTDKLATAIGVLAEDASDRPGLYCSRTRIITEDGEPVGTSPLFGRPPHFRNAIIQNIGGGNTMVLNREAWSAVSTGAERTSFVSHDWWCYLLVSGIGGYVHYDVDPKIGYRQHAENLVGDNMSLPARVDRLKRLMTGRFADWNAANVESLERCADLLDDEARRTLAEFKAIRSSRSIDAGVRFVRSGIYRQSTTGNLALSIAIVLGRL